jgi:hypothetical protein
MPSLFECIDLRKQMDQNADIVEKLSRQVTNASQIATPHQQQTSRTLYFTCIPSFVLLVSALGTVASASAYRFVWTPSRLRST